VPLRDVPSRRDAKERLTVYLRNGRSLTAEVDRPRRLSTRKEIETKFFDCAPRAISTEAATRIHHAVLDLENIGDIAIVLKNTCG